MPGTMLGVRERKLKQTWSPSLQRMQAMGTYRYGGPQTQSECSHTSRIFPGTPPRARAQGGDNKDRRSQPRELVFLLEPHWGPCSSQPPRMRGPPHQSQQLAEERVLHWSHLLGKGKTEAQRT